MQYHQTEPIRGNSEFTSDHEGGWAWAPMGSKFPFDRKIRIALLEHLEGNRIRARWGKRTYTLRYDDDLADLIQSWKVGSKHRVKMWADRIERVLPKCAKDD